VKLALQAKATLKANHAPSKNHSESDRILGLELGADDYISKPFSPRNWWLALRPCCRFDQPLLSQKPVKIGDIEIDPGAMTLTVVGNPVTTTATEFRLLDYFVHHAGRVFTRDQLLHSVWRDTAYVTLRSVDVYVPPDSRKDRARP